MNVSAPSSSASAPKVWTGTTTTRPRRYLRRSWRASKKASYSEVIEQIRRDENNPPRRAKSTSSHQPEQTDAAPPSSVPAPLPLIGVCMHAELQRQWLHSLLLRWEHINLDFLDGKLTAPTFVIDDSKTRLGRWDPHTRTIGISKHHLLEHTWAEIEDTLKHEIAHQVVTELFDAGGSKPHGDLFHRACRMLGMDRSPRSTQDMPPEHVRILKRITRLLNLSTSANTRGKRPFWRPTTVRHNCCRYTDYSRCKLAIHGRAWGVHWRINRKHSSRVLF